MSSLVTALAPSLRRRQRPVPALRTSTARQRAPGLLRRLFGRRQPSLYQRCLAVHIAGAGNTSALR